MHVRNFEDPWIGIVSGRVMERGDKETFKRNVARITATGRIVTNRNSMLRTDIQLAAGGNCSIRMDVIAKIGGFDEMYEGNSVLEDADFSYRAYKAGYKIIP